jgi:putative transposase
MRLEVYPPTGMFIIDEHYHIYNRGAHKAPIFHDSLDYDRFIGLLFAANDSVRLRCGWFGGLPSKFWAKERTPITRISAYCLMPNHFHIVLSQIAESGIERFMHKICTAYTMYYNKKYDHSGTIFQGNYKWKHIDTDEYYRYLLQYIHLNPYGIEEPDLMRTVKSEHYEKAFEFSKNYKYSSFIDYLGEVRPERAVLGAAGG